MKLITRRPGNQENGREMSSACLWPEPQRQSRTLNGADEPGLLLVVSAVSPSGHLPPVNVAFDSSPLPAVIADACAPDGSESSAFPSSRSHTSAASEWLLADSDGCSQPPDYILLPDQLLCWSCLKHARTPARCHKQMERLSSRLPT